ncbi:MAG: alpha/beta hydrolase [Rickettsiales bacterium]|nr:MAG: alpha/beta hydrolase [Rickettsiales bacterium]
MTPFQIIFCFFKIMIHNERNKIIMKIMTTFLITIFAIFFVIYLLMITNKYSLIFPQNKYYKKSSIYEEVFINTKQGKMVSWYYEGDKDKPAILYFHGNGESIATIDLDYLKRDNYTLLVVEYPEYAINKGKINEDNVMEVALENYNFLKEKQENIILYGFSIGTGIASKLASIVKADKLILKSPFYSIEDVVSYWPCSFLFTPWTKGIFTSYKYLQELPNIKLLIVHGTADKIVPFPSGKKLYESAPTKSKKFIQVDNGGHNELVYENIIKELDN